MQVQVHHTPRSAGLPVTRNMPYTTASFPNQALPRNMTGIYLGLVSTASQTLTFDMDSSWDW